MAGDLVKTIDVVICIPTYRRPHDLGKSLAALCRQTSDFHFGVVVANNDPVDVSVREVCQRYSVQLDITLISVAQKGVSAVRNAALAEGLDRAPYAKWLVFQDDDEIATDGWLDELVCAAQEHCAALVGGPCLKEVPSDCRWPYLINDIRVPDGAVKMLTGTNNLLISREYIVGMNREPFLMEYGLSGGEDYEFFRFARNQKARMVWTNKAVLYERWPIERFTLRGVLERQGRKGTYQARVDVNYDGQLAAWTITAKVFARCFLGLLRGLLGRKSLTRICLVGLNSLAEVLGRVRGHLGMIIPYYGS